MWIPRREDYVGAAAVVLGLSYRDIERLPGLTLAESALAAPFASFGGEEPYPTLELKAAVLLEHLVRNHPLPDGNKRAAFALTLRFLERNGLVWGAPDVAIDAAAVRSVAAGRVDLQGVVDWIERRTERRG